MSEDIRLRFSGMMIFAVRVTQILTGAIGVIIIARSFSQAQYGAWTSIAAMVATFALPGSIFPFWSTRYFARGFKGALRLGLAANLSLGLLSAAILIAIGPILAAAAGTLSIFYAFGASTLLVSYSITTLEGAVSVRATHAISYGILAFELTKLTLILSLIAFLGWDIPGALTSLFLANCAWISVYIWVLRKPLGEKMQFQYLRHWVRGSPLNFLLVGAALLPSLEGVILLFLGGAPAVSLVGIAGTVALPIGTTAALSTGLYPKLLTGGTGKDVEISLRLNALFAIPLTLSIIALSPSLLAILSGRVDYTPAYLILWILAVRGFFGTLGGIFDSVIMGTEKFDQKGLVSFGEVVRSRIFATIVFSILDSAIYLPTLWFLLEPTKGLALSSALTTSIVATIATTVLVSFKGFIARRSIRFDFQLASLAKYLFVGGILSSIALILKQPLPYQQTILLVAIGAVIYFAVLRFIDDEARGILSFLIGRIRLLAREFAR